MGYMSIIIASMAFGVTASRVIRTIFSADSLASDEAKGIAACALALAAIAAAILR